MFGLMKARTCNLNDEQKLARRLHYCGACKTIGRMYGQKSRLFLNNDTVFLAEVLTAVAQHQASARDWAGAYQSYNCLSLPRSEAEMPLPLRLAATATVVLAEFKIKDHLSDSPSRIFNLANRVYSRSFSKAATTLEGWGFPVERLRICLESQSEREAKVAEHSHQADAQDPLSYLAEPTATASALFFEHGAAMAGRPELGRAAYQIGYDFGWLTYLLDALEDYERDLRKDEFNAIRQAWDLTGPRLGRAERDRVEGLLWNSADRIFDGIDGLGIDQEWSTLFKSRLRSNLSARLARRLPVLVSGHVCSSKGPRKSLRASWAARINSALSTGRAMAARDVGSRSGFDIATLGAPLVFGSASVIAFLFPEQARSATSYRQCLGIAFNLMFVTALIRSLMPAPLRLAHVHGSAPAPNEPPPGGQPGGPIPGGPIPAEPVPDKKKRGGCSCCCDSDMCDSCECCCDCADCASCCDAC